MNDTGDMIEMAPEAAPPKAEYPKRITVVSDRGSIDTIGDPMTFLEWGMVAAQADALMCERCQRGPVAAATATKSITFELAEDGAVTLVHADDMSLGDWQGIFWMVDVIMVRRAAQIMAKLEHQAMAAAVQQAPADFMHDPSRIIY